MGMRVLGAAYMPAKKDQEEIKNNVSFSSMKSKSPKHLDKGKYGNWVEQLTEKQKSIAVEKAGYLLDLLNYPVEPYPKDQKQPNLPVEIKTEELKNILEQTNWYPLYQ
jgi:aryl sulfotransferase